MVVKDCESESGVGLLWQEHVRQWHRTKSGAMWEGTAEVPVVLALEFDN